METNALRALGGKIDEKKGLKSQSYTSLFSIFELIKGIGTRPDSEKRRKILSSVIKSDLNIISTMPPEMMKSAFAETELEEQSNTVIEQLRHLISNEVSDADSYKKIVGNYEFLTLDFQSKLNRRYVRSKPESEYINLDFQTMIYDQKLEFPSGVKNLPKNAHPSRMAMELYKLKLTPAIFRILFDGEDVSDEDILGCYNDNLDLFFFANEAYELKKKCSRENGAKNDFLDILHTVYLFRHDSIMVSNDKIFKSILPNVNIISIEDYKKLKD